eukprot:gene10977-11058_t
MAAWMLFSPYVTWTDVAAATARAHIADALTEDPQGRLRVVPTSELTEYARRRPGFGFAVFVGGAPLEGSDPSLAQHLGPLMPLLPAQGMLEVVMPEGRRRVLIESVRAPGADRAIATIGDHFMPDDLAGFVATYLPAMIPIFGPSLLAAAIAVPWVVRHAMRPLRAAAEQAGRIEFSALGHRLGEADVPDEALPLVRAVNAALDRLSAGAERQRLFHANAAHELRTPVAILQARLDGMPGLPRGHELRRDAKRIAVLVEQLLAAERLAACGPDTEPVDLVATVRWVVADCAPLAIRTKRGLAFEADVSVEPVRGNARAIESAVANLIDNALRAEPEGGCVHVRIGPGASVHVIDHGDGVAPSDRGLVFEPFWRKDERRSPASMAAR